jgi:hypothetical protein
MSGGKYFNTDYYYSAQYDDTLRVSLLLINRE